MKFVAQAVTFFGCNNLIVTNLRLKNAQQMHVRFQKCNNVTASNLILRAPGNSPNTDGIHVTETKNIMISNSSIGTGENQNQHKIRKKIKTFKFSNFVFSLFCWRWWLYFNSERVPECSSHRCYMWTRAWNQVCSNTTIMLEQIIK